MLINLPSLLSVTRNIVVADNAKLTSFSAPRLAHVGGGVTVDNNELLEAFYVPALAIDVHTVTRASHASGNGDQVGAGVHAAHAWWMTPLACAGQT